MSIRIKEEHTVILEDEEEQEEEEEQEPIILETDEIQYYTIDQFDEIEDEAAVATLRQCIMSDDNDSDEIYQETTVIDDPNGDDDDDGDQEIEVINEPSEYLNVQSLTANKAKTFYCPNCGNCYSAAGSLKLHVRACTRTKDKDESTERRKCNICSKVFNSSTYLKEHLLRHTGKGPKKCAKCYRKFFDDKKFETHMKTHKEVEDTGEGGSGEKKIIKEYTCSFCSKQFTVIFDSRHAKRRYACDTCREKYSNEEMLKKHKASLEEKKEYSCDKCGRKFVFEGFLQRHIPNCDGTIKRKRDKVDN